MDTRFLARLMLLIAVLFLAACTPEAAPTPTLTPMPSPTPEPTRIPTPTATPGPPTAAELFALVSPSVAYVRTEIASGSGVLIAGGYVLTNAHVVWPYRTVRVVFPDGSEFDDAPIYALDLIADLALIGPLETDLPPLKLTNGEHRAIGSDVYLVGYPGEVGDLPQPTFGRGLISNMRQWELPKISYFQTDAVVTGGQSGGILISDRGEVIGLSGLRFTDVSYGMIASAADILPRLDELQREGSDRLVGLPAEGGNDSYRFILESRDVRLFVAYLSEGDTIHLTLEGAELPHIVLIDPLGNVLYEGLPPRTGLLAGVRAEVNGLYFIEVTGIGYATLTSNRPLIEYEDEDDAKTIPVGRTHNGALQYGGDVDHLTMVLQEGDIVNVRVDSMMVHAVLEVGPYYASGSEVAVDDDGGGGVFGRNAELSYYAPADGEYFLTIYDAEGASVGGYVVSVREWERGDPPPFEPHRAFVAMGDEDDMVRYASALYPFSIAIPSDWSFQAQGMMTGVCPDAADTCLYSPSGNAILIVAIDDTRVLSQHAMTLNLFADLTKDSVESVDGFGKVTRRQVVTSSGLRALVLEYSYRSIARYVELIYVHEGFSFAATYVIAESDFPTWADTASRSLLSFEVTDQ